MPTTVYDQRNADMFITGKHVNLVVAECTCGLLFGIPEKLHRSALKHRGPNGWQISCPLGHTWHFTGDNESIEERKLREQLERERTYSANVIARLDQAQASLSATKGVVTRMKRRASAGVCPCCNRTFQQLARHMATRHPGFVADQGGEAASLPHAPSPPRASHRFRADALLAFLADGPRRYMEIIDGLGITKGHGNMLIHRAMNAGEIVRMERGLYRRAE